MNQKNAKEVNMKKYIPIDKRSKREQKEFYSSQRNTWNGLNPATRTVPNGKGYDRNRQKAKDRRNSRRSNDYGTPAVFICGDMCFGL